MFDLIVFFFFEMSLLFLIVMIRKDLMFDLFRVFEIYFR